MHRYETPPIYNYVPDAENMVTWRRYMEDGFEYGCDIPMRKSIWYPRFTIVPHMWQYHILCFLYHTLPALVMDAIMVIIGKKPRWVYNLFNLSVLQLLVHLQNDEDLP